MIATYKANEIIWVTFSEHTFITACHRFKWSENMVEMSTTARCDLGQTLWWPKKKQETEKPNQIEILNRISFWTLLTNHNWINIMARSFLLFRLLNLNTCDVNNYNISTTLRFALNIFVTLSIQNNYIRMLNIVIILKISQFPFFKIFESFPLRTPSLKNGA